MSSAIITPKLTKAYEALFDELASKRYVVRGVHEHYVQHGGAPDDRLPTVVLRVDVDNGFHLSWPLAVQLHQRGLTASHYFLTNSDRYYDIWGSDIPRRINQLSQEVGLHTDHFFDELTLGIDGLASLKSDIKRLSELIGEPIKGMVYHGHSRINAYGVTNWDLTKDIHPEDLNLEYHDGLKSCYIKPNAKRWEPNCNTLISDYMGFSESWGWNYYPDYPVKTLKRNAQKLGVIHISFHTQNAFEYWNHWQNSYNEEMIKRDSTVLFIKKSLSIRINPIRNKIVRHTPSLIRKVIKGIIQNEADER